MKYELTVILSFMLGNLVGSHIAQGKNIPEFREHYLHKISSTRPRYYLILSILVAEIGWNGLRIDFFGE